jgi:hypothetical protein
MNKSPKQLCSSFFLIFITTYFFSGCTAAKELPPGQVYSIPSWKNLYFFHSEDSTWIVKPVTAPGNQFSAIVFKPELIKKKRQVHIYAEPLSSVTIKDRKLSVPMENIVKVENYKISIGTVLLSAGVVALLFLIPVYL